jgi:integrase
MLTAYADQLDARSMSRKTIERYTGTVRSFARFLDPTPLDQATALDVEEWLRIFRNPKTRHAYRSDLKLFYAWAIRRHGFTSNPVDDVDPVRVPKALPRPLGDEEIPVVLHYGPLRTRRAVALGMLAGLRNAEIAALDAADVSLHHRLLAVRDGKGRKDRIVPVHPTLARLLDGIGGRGPVIVGRHGGPVQPDTVGDIIRRHFHQLDVHATPHQLRHTFGTEMARAAGGNLVVVAKVMGHASTNTTMGYVGWNGEAGPIIAAMFSDVA